LDLAKQAYLQGEQFSRTRAGRIEAEKRLGALPAAAVAPQPSAPQPEMEAPAAKP
jgi:hypothetical protein